jgi:FtsP/CotA-like multicopper oxidase with cupredoxin domain
MEIMQQVEQPGTYWYHSHVKGQYPDGLRGPLIVHDPNDPFAAMYDEQVIVTWSDWYHEQMSVLASQFLSTSNPDGVDPAPQSALMNDLRDVKVNVQPNRTYLFRMINMAAISGFYVWIEGHQMEIVEVDGVYTERAPTAVIYITSGQRYSVLVKTRNDTLANFAIVGSVDLTLFEKMNHGSMSTTKLISKSTPIQSSSMSMPMPSATHHMSMPMKRDLTVTKPIGNVFSMVTPMPMESPSMSMSMPNEMTPFGDRLNVTGWLVYDSSKAMPTPTPLSKYNSFDDFVLSPLKKESLLQVDHSITLNVTMDSAADGVM